MLRSLATIAGLVALLISGVRAAEPPAAPVADPLPRAVLEKLYAGEIPKYDPANFEKLLEAHQLLEKYFAASHAEDRRTITKVLQKGPVDVATLGRLCRIRMGWMALPPGPAYVNERIGPHDVQYFLGVPKNYDRAKAWPLVIRLPAINAVITDMNKPPTPDDVTRMYTSWIEDELQRHPDAVVIMPLMNFDELYGPSTKGMNTVIQSMHHVASRVNIDPSRVYMTGHGMAAHATWNLALHYPTYFAAINPLAGAASGDWQRVRMLNLRNMLAIVWADDDDKVIPPAQSAALVSILRTNKYDVAFEKTRGIGHGPTAQLIEKCYDQMRARQREVYPKQVVLRSNRLEPVFNRIDWVQIYQPVSAGAERRLQLRHGTGPLVVTDGLYTVWATRTGPQKIEARSDNVATMRFCLNDQMMDLSKPVTIIVNNKTRFEGLVTQSVDEMLRDQIAIGRGWRYFTCSVEVDIFAGSSTTRPATQPASGPTSSRFFFTTDEGKTIFVGNPGQVAPFEVGEKKAARAHVFSCDGGKTTFVGYLSKNPPAQDYPLYKRVGGEVWVSGGTSAAAGTAVARCPHGDARHQPVELFPSATDVK